MREFEMSKRFTAAALGLAAVAGAVFAGQAPIAAAQPYSGGGYYDPCQRDATSRGTVGAFVGGGTGAVIGSQLAARGHRTDGSVLGGVLGAVAGAVIGNRSAACVSGREYYPAQRPAYSYGGGYGGGYRDELYTGGRGYYRQGYYDAPRYPRETVTIIDRPDAGAIPDANGCTMAESPIYMPDGRTQKRMVRVCPDSSGRYQVVD
jgi:hypothetical protein